MTHIFNSPLPHPFSQMLRALSKLLLQCWIHFASFYENWFTTESRQIQICNLVRLLGQIIKSNEFDGKSSRLFFVILIAKKTSTTNDFGNCKDAQSTLQSLQSNNISPCKGIYKVFNNIVVSKYWSKNLLLWQNKILPDQQESDLNLRQRGVNWCWWPSCCDCCCWCCSLLLLPLPLLWQKLLLSDVEASSFLGTALVVVIYITKLALKKLLQNSANCTLYFWGSSINSSKREAMGVLKLCDAKGVLFTSVRKLTLIGEVVNL